MSFFEEVKKTFLNREELFELRYSAAKYAFIIFSIIFFVDYFFIANNFFTYKLVSSLSVVYVIFLFSFYLYACFLIAKLLFWRSKINQAFLFLILLAIFLVFSIPFVLPKWFLNIF